MDSDDALTELVRRVCYQRRMVTSAVMWQGMVDDMLRQSYHQAYLNEVSGRLDAISERVVDVRRHLEAADHTAALRDVDEFVRFLGDQ